MTRINFNFYGFQVLIASVFYNEEDLVFVNDFSYFKQKNEKNKNFNLKIYLSKLSHFSKHGVRIGTTRLSEFRQIDFKTRQYIYNKNSKSIATSFDRISKKNRFFHLKSNEAQAINEILYYYILSVVGEYFDTIGLMRVHACSFAQVNDGSTVVWGLPGAGKSTLATLLTLFEDSRQLQVLSDEMSLIELNKKIVCPFPMRFSLKKETALLINKMLDSTESKKISFGTKGFFFDKKLTVDCQASLFSQLSKAPLNNFYVLEKSHLFSVEKINFLSKFKLYYKLIFGIGLIQMYEYFIRLENLPALIKILHNRIKLCATIHKLPIKILKRGSNFSTNHEQLLLFFKQNKSD